MRVHETGVSCTCRATGMPGFGIGSHLSLGLGSVCFLCALRSMFNVFGASHCWWHICINVGNALVFPVWRSYLQFRHENTC